MADALSDRVRFWFTVNEPTTFIGNGYFTGAHAPFESLMQEQPAVMMNKLAVLTKNVLLAHGKAVRVLRSRAKLAPKIGMALNGSVYLPENESPDDIEKARTQMFPEQAFFSHFNWWADPVVLGCVPAGLQPFFTAEELKVICQPLDFFGFNCYNASNYEEYMRSQPRRYAGYAPHGNGLAHYAECSVLGGTFLDGALPSAHYRHGKRYGKHRLRHERWRSA